MRNKYEMRMAQLDLARQKESLSFIEEFITFIADCNYNVLFLYLEWRVATKSFNYLPSNEHYTEAEIRHLIAFASKRNIEVIPGLAILGHCELFLNVTGNDRFAETNDRKTGRFFNEAVPDLCPSHPEIRHILTTYLREIAELFPSQYIHLGGDEVWNINYCDRCRAKGTDYESEAELYREFVTFFSNYVSEKLKRVPMIWDDMWEYYHFKLKEMPRNLIMVHWQYQNDVTFRAGSFLNLNVSHWLKEYETLGFKYLIAPADHNSTSNARTLSEYAENGKHLLGGIFTCWTKQHLFMYRSFIRIAYCGALWSGNSKDVFSRIAKQLFGISDDLFVNAIFFFAEAHGLRDYNAEESTLLTFDYFGMDYGKQAGRLFVTNVLRDYLKKIKTDLGLKILEDIILMYDYQNVSFRAHKYVRDLCNRNNRNVNAEENEINACLNDILTRNTNAWKKWRDNTLPDNATTYYANIASTFKSLCENIRKSGLLRLRFALPDKYSLYKTAIFIRAQNGIETKIADLAAKPQQSSESQFFERVFLVSNNIVPESIRIEGRGYGGTGICYAELATSTGTYVPYKISRFEGTVDSPEYILDNDCKWSFLGCRDSTNAYKNRKIAEETSLLEIKLSKAGE